VSYEFYKLLHIFSLIGATTALGGLITGATGGFRRALVALHGTALFIMLVAGFGALAKLGVGGLPGWVTTKLVIWLVLGAIVVPARRMPEKKGTWIAAVVVLASSSGWLAIAKPF